MDTRKQPSIFLRKKKKPTVASTGDRPLLKPFVKTVDYSNPRKFDLTPHPKTARGVPISLPRTTATLTSASTEIAESFVFDNHTQDSHTQDSQLGSQDSTQDYQAQTSNSRSIITAIDSLASSNNSHATLTILRIKRKRNEEPLDTLVVQENDDTATKKQRKLEDRLQPDNVQDFAKDTIETKPHPAVFRLATTVNSESFKDPAHSIQLREKITHLTATHRPRSRLSDRHPQEFEDRVFKRRGELVQEKHEEARIARYRVISQNRAGLTSTEQRPPQVKSSVEVEAEAILDVFKMYDAVKEEEQENPEDKETHAQTLEESDIMCNFLPMVREYLSISDSATADPKIVTEAPCEPPPPPPTTESKDTDVSSEDEYVYDIYYCDPHADHQQESRYRAIGSLLWFSDDENDFIPEDDSSAYGDDDSDSNAEDYYQNDYPEDEFMSDNVYGLSDTDDEYMY
ncbi:solute carrier 7, member 6 opposite strand [Modicella reniformis]|uniref:Probable RNA polymerase II nuclear localization protein SLC7A6OS n=1 Tax=Modicella reniformis TaxID=1440133 RepID=A0A9P6M131_9FUNG|nr:solute carrier 7, member 6 opposite strand [Modicella reniformis]